MQNSLSIAQSEFSIIILALKLGEFLASINTIKITNNVVGLDAYSYLLIRVQDRVLLLRSDAVAGQLANDSADLGWKRGYYWFRGLWQRQMGVSHLYSTCSHYASRLPANIYVVFLWLCWHGKDKISRDERISKHYTHVPQH